MDWAKLESWVIGAGCCVWVKLGVDGLVSVWVSVFVDEDAIGKKIAARVFDRRLQ
jgi:hypothetical protein